MPQTRQHDLRPIIMRASDLPEGDSFLWHQHERSQLVYAISGVMAVTTRSAVYGCCELLMH